MFKAVVMSTILYGTEAWVCTGTTFKSIHLTLNFTTLSLTDNEVLERANLASIEATLLLR